MALMLVGDTENRYYLKGIQFDSEDTPYREAVKF